MYETVLGALARGGWTSERLVAVLTSVEVFLLGSALDLAVPPLMIDPSAGGAAVPLPAAALDGVPRKVARAEEAFAAGLDALVRGLMAQLAEARA
ncbi:hypothetical protein ACFVTP_08485 [Streptomyces celluloflavus]|uniref:hypothetical protein n=1 Tax=Streptomyces celluloflavus TaxID=58344 RepID=UPI0036D9C6D1